MQKKRNGEFTTFLGHKTGRFPEARADEKEIILRHLEDEIKSWAQLIDVVEKSASPNGPSCVQVGLQNDVKVYKSDLQAIANEMSALMKQSGRKSYDKLKNLQDTVAAKAHEEKAPRWLLCTNLVVGQQNTSAITEVSAKCMAQWKLLESILERQKNIETKLLRVEEALQLQADMHIQLDDTAKETEATLKTILQTLNDFSAQKSSGEGAATPPPTPSLGRPADAAATSIIQTPAVSSPKTVRSSESSPPLFTTPTQRQRLSLNIAPQSQTSSSQFTTSLPMLRSERTGGIQYTADTSQEDIYSDGKESAKDNDEYEQPSCPAHSPTHPLQARCGLTTSAYLANTEDQHNIASAMWDRAQPDQNEYVLNGIYSGNLERGSTIGPEDFDINQIPEEIKPEIALAVAIPDCRLRNLILVHNHAIKDAIPVESSRRIVTIVVRMDGWPSPFRSTLDSMRKISRQPDLGFETAAAAPARQVAVLRWDDIVGQSAGQVYAYFRVIRAIHERVQEKAWARIPFKGMVVCVPVRLEEYRKWAEGADCSEALDTLWEHGILATVPIKSQRRPWCPKLLNGKLLAQPS